MDLFRVDTMSSEGVQADAWTRVSHAVDRQGIRYSCKVRWGEWNWEGQGRDVGVQVVWEKVIIALLRLLREGRAGKKS